MKKNIIAFGASNSRTSINKALASYAGNQLEDTEVAILDLNDYEMPIYSTDRENEEGIPEKAIKFKEFIKKADGVLISFAEHNGSYTAAFKNIMDWVSRVEQSLWADKPMLLLATSPGSRGGQGVLASATGAFPHQGGRVISSFSLPSFHQNFDTDKGISNAALRNTLTESIEAFRATL